MIFPHTSAIFGAAYPPSHAIRHTGSPDRGASARADAYVCDDQAGQSYTSGAAAAKKGIWTCAASIQGIKDWYLCIPKVADA